MASKLSYQTPVKLKPLDKNKYSQDLIDRAYSLYVKDFYRHRFKGQVFTLQGFEEHAFNRDLFIHEAIIIRRNKAIKKILNDGGI